jgi:hypothetical protein
MTRRSGLQVPAAPPTFRTLVRMAPTDSTRGKFSGCGYQWHPSVRGSPYRQGMTDTWTSRELPVLRAIVTTYDETGRPILPNQIEAASGLDPDTVQQALRALKHEDPPFVASMEYGGSGIEIGLVGPPTGHARRAVGAWPTAEALADRLVAALDSAADQETNEDRKGWLKKTAMYLGGAGRDLAVEVLATTLSKQTGI